ncbi:MAG: FecR domain-containing protein [Spirochaetes bacterium]|nr:FecR domain-containing protein [Spirochaetota bacterium]
MSANIPANMFTKKNILTVLIVLSAILPVSAQDAIGEITYTEGGVELLRNGEIYSGNDVFIGRQIENLDLINTESDGELEAEITSSSNSGAVIKIAPNTSFTFEINKIGSVNKTSIGIITGTISLKVKKLTGKNEFEVRTDSTVLGVRGTSFTVTAPPTGEILITCREGRVLITDNTGKKLMAEPGTAVENRPGEIFRSIPVAVSSLSAFRRDWYAERIEVFKKNALKALRAYHTLYIKYHREFNIEYTSLLKEHMVLNKWFKEDKEGKIGSKIALMREKKRIIGHLFRMRRVLFMFERIYFRILELKTYYDEGYGRGMLGPGISAAGFYRKFNSERKELEKKMAMVRYVVKLYAKRNRGSLPLDIFSSQFGSTDDGFGKDMNMNSDF